MDGSVGCVRVCELGVGAIDRRPRPGSVAASPSQMGRAGQAGMHLRTALSKAVPAQCIVIFIVGC